MNRVRQPDPDPLSPHGGDDAGGPAGSPLDTLTQTELVLPEQTNHYGTLFAPHGLALLGKMAYLVATRYTRQPVVMAAADRIQFLKPVPAGAVLRFTARVTRVGRTSLTARVAACLDAAMPTGADDALRGDFELVAVDAAGRPCAIALLPPSSRRPPLLHVPDPEETAR